MGYIHDGDGFSEETQIWSVQIIDWNLRFAPSGTLWSVEVRSEASQIVWETSVPRTLPPSLFATTTIHRSHDVAATSHHTTAWLHPTQRLPKGNDCREQSTESLRDSFGDPDAPSRTELKAWNAVRLATGLVHDLRDASRLRAVLVSNGVPLRLASAPDFIALEGGEWIRCLGWPVLDGRLRAPSVSTGLVFDVVRLARTPGFALPSVLGVAIFSPSPICLTTRVLDWRTDEQVLEDVENLAALVEKIQARGQIEGLDDLASDIAKVVSHAPSSREVFRLRRLLEVTEDRGEPLAPGFASVLPDVDRLHNMIDREVEERRRMLLGELAAEIEAERARGSSVLDDLRNEIADAKRSIALLRSRAKAYRRAADELRVELSDKVDRRLLDLASAHDRRSAAWLAEVETNRERLEALAAQVGMIEEAVEGDRDLRRDVLDRIREALEDEQTIRMLTGRIAEFSSRDDAALPKSGAERSSETLVSNPTAARASLRWHARENGLEERSLHAGFSISAVGLLPIFIGAAAGDAAVALARAVGGEGFSTLYCDPTLIAVSDLLDPKRARTDVLLAAIEAARRIPDRWHAVVLISIDWAPCAYWLAALAAIGPGPSEMPRNLLVVGAAAADGPRTHVSLGALRNAVPIRVVTCRAGQDGYRPIGEGWSISIGPGADAGDDEQADSNYRTELIMLLGVELSTASLGLIMGSAKVGRKVLCWTTEEAFASLASAAEWIAAARDGATLTPDARAAMETFASQDET